MIKKIQQKNLRGIVPPQAELHIRDITEVLQSQASDIAALQSAGFITSASLPTPADITQNVSAPGAKPLNVTGLQGVLSQPQTPYFQTVTSLPPINSPLSQNGTVVIYNGSLWYFVANPIPGVWKPVPTLAVVLFGVHSTRLTVTPATYPPGTIYYETDRTVWYINQTIAGVQYWVYSTGDFACALANLPADLTAQDQGFMADVRDYNHKLIWGKTRDQAYSAGWDWAPGEPGDSGKIEGFLVDPTSAGWHLCDGTAGVTYLKSDGTTGTVTLPALTTTPAYLKFSTPASATINPAVAPTFTGAALATHAHELPMCIDSGEVPKDIDYMPETAFGTGSTQNFTSHQLLPLTTSENLPTMLSSAVSAGTPAGTITATAEPPNLILRPWFRQ